MEMAGDPADSARPADILTAAGIVSEEYRPT
jgi:hypothetical protein